MEEIVNETKEYENAYKFPRIIAFIIDLLIVFLVSTLLTAVFSNSKTELYSKELNNLSEQYMNQKITMKEFNERVSPIAYDLDHENVPVTFIQIVFTIGYFVLLPFYNNGQTLGKKLLKIKIISTTDNNLSINNYLLRSCIINTLIFDIIVLGAVLFMNSDMYYTFYSIVQTISFVIIFISILMALFSKEGLSLHDRLARTKVVMCK